MKYKTVHLILPHPQPFSKGEGGVGLFYISHWYYLLNQLKTCKQVFKTGQNNHGTKFIRIARLLKAYPEQKFILLGDDSQEDPFIYAAVAEDFKEQVFCIYIRKVSKAPKPLVENKIVEIEKSGVLF